MICRTLIDKMISLWKVNTRFLYKTPRGPSSKWNWKQNYKQLRFLDGNWVFLNNRVIDNLFHIISSWYIRHHLSFLILKILIFRDTIRIYFFLGAIENVSTKNDSLLVPWWMTAIEKASVNHVPMCFAICVIAKVVEKHKSWIMSPL